MIPDPETPELRAGCYFVDSGAEEVRAAISAVRAGKSLQPAAWHQGARVAVAITFDVDHELPLYKLEPSILSLGEYGALTGMPRILSLLEQVGIPATFFVPGMTQLLHPETIPSILESGRHEVGLHGWVHERAPDLRGRDDEAKLIAQAIDVVTSAAGGERPLGYRAPNSALSDHTLELLAEQGLLYDSTLSARDVPHELLLRGQLSHLIEMPISWEADDYIYLHMDEFWQGAMPSPDGVLQAFIRDFDGARAEGTLFNLVLHPHVIGRRSRIYILERLLEHIRQFDDVWFATLGDIADFAKRACA